MYICIIHDNWNVIWTKASYAGQARGEYVVVKTVGDLSSISGCPALMAHQAGTLDFLLRAVRIISSGPNFLHPLLRPLQYHDSLNCSLQSEC